MNKEEELYREVVDWMYQQHKVFPRDPLQLAADAASMFDLWDKNDSIPEWIDVAATDICLLDIYEGDE